MKQWLITETVEYVVTASTRDEAEEVFLESGPTSDVECPVRMLCVTERVIEEAAA